MSPAAVPHIVIFDEPADDRFPGFESGRPVSELPFWSKFTVESVTDAMFKRFDYSRIKIPDGDIDALCGVLENTGGDILVAGRSGNITMPDTVPLNGMSRGKGIVKLQIGGVPSDLYLIGKSDLIKAVRSLSEHGNSPGRIPVLLFEKYFFDGFERIVGIGGSSFLLRDGFEFFRENLRFASYLNDPLFMEFYSGLADTPTEGSSVSDRGVVRESVLGGGCRICGTIENSVIFHDVVVEEGAAVRDSVILPFNRVEGGCIIQNTLVLPRKGGGIGAGSIIGGTDLTTNRSFPRVLREGLTIVGEGIEIPPGSRIGSGCLVRGPGSSGRRIRLKNGCVLDR